LKIRALFLERSILEKASVEKVFYRRSPIKNAMSIRKCVIKRVSHEKF
jgi:hypothetical protein